MKSKKFTVILTSVLMMCCVFCFGCKDNNPPKQAIATIDGMEIQSIEIFNLEGDYYNISIGIKNTTEEIKIMDFAKIVLKLGDTSLLHNGSPTEYAAGQYFKWSCQIDIEGSDLTVGDNVDVYYEDQFLTNVVVTEF